jgi:hypothetical protein
MHAAKGLEWPVVMPINTMTQIIAPENAVTDRDTGHSCLLRVTPVGYDRARDAEKAEPIGSTSASGTSLPRGRAGWFFHDLTSPPRRRPDIASICRYLICPRLTLSSPCERDSQKGFPNRT